MMIRMTRDGREVLAAADRLRGSVRPHGPVLTRDERDTLDKADRLERAAYRGEVSGPEILKIMQR